MSTTYFKRLHMEIDVRRIALPEPRLPEGYAWAAWHPVLAAAHARAKFESFWGEIDAEVFETLSHLEGCERLMTDISHHQGFAAPATWLIRFEGNEFEGPSSCGTIQGLKKGFWTGSIQNVGVARAHRGFGLGRALVLKALRGFQELRLYRVRLEVTAANEPAVELYRSLGFRVRRTSYRSVIREPQPIGA